MIGYALDAVLLAGIVGLGVGWWRAERRAAEHETWREFWYEQFKDRRDANVTLMERQIAQPEARQALRDIAAATRNIKHGTARRVHRMAVQALEGDGE
jgi:hypothetical protein